MTKILCVEDSEDSLFTLHKRLSLAGFEVKGATNGTEGVDWAKTLRPQLIVMDLRLPGLDGWEATRRLKSQQETKHIPIIVVTADASEKSREKAFAAGDRKSTRLNSSHSQISYAVFYLTTPPGHYD